MPHKPKNLAPEVDIESWNQMNEQFVQRLDEMSEAMASLQSRIEMLEETIMRKHINSTSQPIVLVITKDKLSFLNSFQ